MTPRLADVELVGERVRLRPVRPEDAPRGFACLHGRAEILDQLVYDGPRTLEDMQDRYASWRRVGDDADDHLLAIEDRADGVFVGTINASLKGHPFLASVGYWVEPERWGRGLATDAIRLVTHLVFQHLNVGTASAEVFDSNPASRRVLEKVGYTESGRASAPSLAGGAAGPERWVMTILRSQFQEACAGWAPVTERVELLGA